jgi:hypothetical protein
VQSCTRPLPSKANLGPCPFKATFHSPWARKGSWLLWQVFFNQSSSMSNTDYSNIVEQAFTNKTPIDSLTDDDIKALYTYKVICQFLILYQLWYILIYFLTVCWIRHGFWFVEKIGCFFFLDDHYLFLIFWDRYSPVDNKWRIIFLWLFF